MSKDGSVDVLCVEGMTRDGSSFRSLGVQK
jgi:hypothetical protein